MAGRKKDGEWSEWKYIKEKGLYVSSRINRHGKKERRAILPDNPPEDEEPQTAPSYQAGLEEGIDRLSLSPDEPQPERDEVSGQGRRFSSGNEPAPLQLSPSQYGTSPELTTYSQGQGGRYSISPPSTTGLEAQGYPPNPSGYTQSDYTASLGSEQGTGYGGSQPGSATPQSSVDISPSSALGGFNGSWNSAPQFPPVYNSPRPMMNPNNSSFKDQNQTGLVNNSQHKQEGYGMANKPAPSVLDVRHTKTDRLPKIPLWKEFKLSSSKDFKPGYVFKVVWTEPGGKNNGRSRGKQSNFSYVADAQYGELAYTSIRRFAIYKSRVGHSLCLPILTYGGQGTTKPGVKPAHHAIIYTTLALDNPPLPAPLELNGEGPLPNLPIRVEATSPRHNFDTTSRINYAKVYTVEHNIKVCFVGKIHKDSIAEFQTAYARVDAMQDDNLHPDNMVYTY